jgi:mono/diheme cytochrome c family protein
MKGRVIALIVLVAVVAAGIAAYSIVSRGLSAHAEPSRIETVVARAMRHWATPAAMRDRANPVQPSPAVLDGALEHFADHCATCHANNGSGDTPIGRNLYPRAPDMRAAATQSLTDGELFSIIEHGVRLTGMPAWSTGTPDGERESWALVHFIRYLPKLTDDELARMEALNPKTPRELKAHEDPGKAQQGESGKRPEPHHHGEKKR